MKDINELCFVDPQSYNNLAFYDWNLLNNLNIKKIYFFGNEKYSLNNNKNIIFKKIYKYSNKNIFLKGFSYIFSQFFLLINLIKINPDVIHFQWFKLPYFDIFLLKILNHLTNSNIVFTAHNILPHDTGNKHYKIFKFIYNNLDGIIVHNLKSKNELREKFNIQKDKIRIIPHGILKFHYDKEKVLKEKKMLKKKYSLSNKTIFSFLGKIREDKGINYILDAWEKSSYLNSNKEISLIIAGNCKNKKLQKKIEKINRFNNVILDIRFLPEEIFMAYMHLTDILLLPYEKISQSGLLFTAISEEKLVLMSKRGGLKEVYQKSKIGWQLENLYKENLIRKIKYIIEKENIEKIKKQKFRWKKLKKIYSWNTIGKKTVKFYKYLKDRLY